MFRQLLCLMVVAVGMAPLARAQSACGTAQEELKRARTMLSMADSALQKEAEVLIKRSLQLCPTSSEVLRLASKAYDDLGDDVQARYWRKEADRIEAATNPAAIDQGPPPVDYDQPPRGRAAIGENYGLIIAIQHYPKAPEVSFADGDALVMREYFLRVLGVRETRLKILTAEQATLANIRGALDWARTAPRPGSTLFVYYAGHGLADLETKGNLLVPYDFDPNKKKTTLLDLKAFYGELESSPASQVMVFLDSCFSGMAARSGANTAVVPGERAAFLDITTAPPRKVLVLAAASGEQTSSAYQRARHGLFTYFLLAGLSGGAHVDASGAVTLKALADYVSGGVKEQAAKMGRNQTPTLSTQVDPVSVVVLKTR